MGVNANKQVTASVLETHKRNNLALLRISSTQMASVETKSLIRKSGLKLVPSHQKDFSSQTMLSWAKSYWLLVGAVLGSGSLMAFFLHNKAVERAWKHFSKLSDDDGV